MPFVRADALPPASDITAEKAVLCAVVMGVVGDVIDRIDPQWFYFPAHRRIAEASRSLRASGSRVDAITLSSALRASGHLTEVGGTAFLSELFDASPNVRNLSDHVEIVRKAARARLLDANLTAAHAMLRNGTDPTEVATFVSGGCTVAIGNGDCPKVLNADDIFSAPNEIQCVVSGLGIKPGPPQIFAAPSGIGKSMILQSAAISSVLGKPWWGLFPVLKPLRVLWVDLEQGKQTTLLRFKRIALGSDSTAADLRGMLDVLISPDVSDESKLTRLMGGYDLVFFDCLRAMAPEFDENDSRMRSPIDACARASEKTGCSALLIHHSRKDGEPGKGSKRDKMRGSSAIRDASDAVYQLDRDGDLSEGPIECGCTKTPRATGRAPEDWILEIRDVDVWHNADHVIRNGGVAVLGRRQAKVDPFDVKREQRRTNTERVRRALIPVFNQQRTWKSAEALAATTHIRKADVLEALVGWESVTINGHGSHKSYTYVGDQS
jgi:hypothetical protein